MPLATFKDLVIDAADAKALGRFWADALHLELHVHDDGDTHLTGPTKGHTIWVNQVPEPRTVKQRLHLDVNAGSVKEIERLGATVVDGESFHWTLMTDPEGGELCVFVQEGEISQRLFEVVIDCGADAHPIAAWWAEILGGRLVDSERGFSYVEAIPNAPFDSLDFIPVPEPKTVKNRIHIDVTTDDLDALVARGATMLRAQDDEIAWNVMADPDGNEFCAFVS